MVNQNHPYYTLAVTMYPRVVNKLLMGNQITQQEAQMLLQRMNGPDFTQFVQNVISQVPALQGEAHMEKLLTDNYISSTVNYIRQAMGTYGGARPMVTNGWGGGVMVPAGGYMMPNGGVMPVGGATRPGSQWFTGNQNPNGAGVMSFRPAGGPATMPPTMRAQPPQQKKDPEPAKPKQIQWTIPEIIQDRSVNMNMPNNTAFEKKEFVEGETQIVEVYAIDNRPRYESPEEAIAAFKWLLNDSSATKKFLTVCYYQLKVVRANRNDVVALMKDVAVQVGNINCNDLERRLTTIITTCDSHPSGAVAAFQNLILDEIHEHIYSGALADSKSVKFAVTLHSLAQIRDILTGNLPQETRNALRTVANFDQAFRQIVSKVINTVVVNGAYKKVLDPMNDKTIIDVYGKLVPPIWYNPSAGVYESTESLFMRYLSSLKMVGGTKSEAAVTAEQQLHSKLELLDRNFTVFQVPRIITWCNSPSSSVVGWNEDGSCSPIVYNDKNVNNDIAFFLNRVMLRTDKAETSSQKNAPCKVVCEVDEGSIKLDYGTSSDGNLWVGSVRYLYNK